MKQKRRAKTRYFRKDYKPAIYAANKRKAQKPQTKVTKVLKKVAINSAQAVRKIVKSTAKVTQKFSHTTNTRSPARKKQPKFQPFTWREITLFSQIGVSIVAILFTFIFCDVNDPVKRSQTELERIARDYYIEYLYPASLGKYLHQPETVLKDYTESGLPAVRLRQLLLYNNGQFAQSADAFSNSYYQCNTNKTLVTYYPVAPYGPRDVVTTFNTDCEKIGI